MRGQLVVRVGAAGLSWDDELTEVLAEATGLVWERDSGRERAEAGPSQGIETILLTAALTSLVDDAVKTALHKANEAIGQWRKGHLDPPEVSVGIETAPQPDAQPDTGPATDAAPEPPPEARTTADSDREQDE